MKIGNIFLASIFLSSFLIVCAQEKKKTEVNLCEEYAARNKEFKVEYEIESSETITDMNGGNHTVEDLGDASVSCIWSFGSDQQCRFESKISEIGSKQCHNISSSPFVIFNKTKCVLEFSETSNVTNLIKNKLRQDFNNTFM